MSIDERDRNKNFTLGNADKVVLFLLGIKLALTAVFFPEWEMPDEALHFTRMATNSFRNIYYSLMHQFYNLFCNFQYNDWRNLEANANFTFASNSMAYIHKDFNCMLPVMLKFAQIFIIILFIFAVYFVLKRIKISNNEKTFIFRLNLLFFSWPSVSLSLVSFNLDFFIYFFEALFFILLVYYNRFFLLLFGSIIMYKFFDNNAMMLIAVIFFYVFYSYLLQAKRKVFSLKKKILFVFMAFILILIYGLLIHIGVIPKLFPFFKANIIDWCYLFKYEPLKSFGTTFLGLYYLGGSVSLLAFLPEYVLFFILIVYCLRKLFLRESLQENSLFLYALSSFTAYNIILLTYPVIDQGRYYYFLIPFLIVIFDRYLLKSKLFLKPKYYLIFSVVLFVSSIIKIFNATIRAFLLY
ncbi:MAG: hypothetical protein KKA52_02405 [Candidatus Omnitrophica bacterium]|nr:hypothetical protein [Candidatus Omnitrophota bacterium]